MNYYLRQHYIQYLINYSDVMKNIHIMVKVKKV